MSQFDDQKDFEILDLLYEEMDESEAESLKAKLESDPEAAERLHGWAAVRALSRHVVNEEPELSDHYAILRQARNRVSEPEPVSWWQRLANLAQVPAFAGLVLIVFSGGLFYSLTGQVSDETIPSLQKSISPTKSPVAEGKKMPRAGMKKSLLAPPKLAEDKVTEEDNEELDRKPGVSKRATPPPPAKIKSKPADSSAKSTNRPEPFASKQNVKPRQDEIERNANQVIRRRQKSRKSKTRRPKSYQPEVAYSGQKMSGRKGKASKKKARKKKIISKELGGIGMPLTDPSSGLRLNGQSARQSDQSKVRSGFAPPPPTGIEETERTNDSLPRAAQTRKSRGSALGRSRPSRKSGLEKNPQSVLDSPSAVSKGGVGKRGRAGGNVQSMRSALKRGRAAFGRGRYREAIRLYQNALKAISNSATLRDQVLFELAQAYEKAGSAREATDIYRRLSERKSPVGRRAKKRLKSMSTTY